MRDTTVDALTIADLYASRGGAVTALERCSLSVLDAVRDPCRRGDDPPAGARRISGRDDVDGEPHCPS